MSSFLTENFPKAVVINGTEVPIYTDFRVFINFELILQDELLSDEERIGKILKLCYPRVPVNIVEAIEQLLWFYTCGKEAKGKKKGKILYRYDCDGEYIYSAFLSQYKIDLQSVSYMHWWKFRFFR